MNLLYNFNQSTVIEKVTMKWPSDEYVIPAGTPMSRTGIANDKNAIGILAREERIQFRYPLSVAKHIGKEEPKGKKDHTFSLITSGFVNLTDAEASFGAKISEEAKAAMGEINFVNETEPASFGGGGGGNILETVGSDTLTWDGNTEGLVSVLDMMYKVSDAIPTNDEIKTAKFTYLINGVEGSGEIAGSWDNMVEGGYATDDFCTLVEAGFVVRKANITFKGITFPETGIYFAKTVDGSNSVCTTSLTIPNYKKFPPFKEQIKEEYIPDSLKGGGDSLFAKLGYDMEYVYFGDKSFPIREDIMSGNTIVSDDDFASIETIISEKIIYTKVYGEGMVICRFSVNNGYISVTMGSDTMELYSESASQ